VQFAGSLEGGINSGTVLLNLLHESDCAWDARASGGDAGAGEAIGAVCWYVDALGREDEGLLMGEGDGLRADKAFQSFPGKFLYTLSTFNLTRSHQIRTQIHQHPSPGTRANHALLRPSSAPKSSRAARSVSRIRAYLRNRDRDTLRSLPVYTRMYQRSRRGGSSTL
jgi:hypothetical protein